MKGKKRKSLLVLIFSLLMSFCSLSAFAKENTTIIMLNPNRDYAVGETMKVTIGISSPDGAYLKSAICGFGYNASTMRIKTETLSHDHFEVTSDIPTKWLYYEIEFEMINNGKMYFIAGAYSGNGVVKAIKSDGSRIDLPRASVVYKIGTGIYTNVSDCNLQSLDLIDEAGDKISPNRDFDKNITEYWIEVDPSISELKIEAKTENPDDKVIFPDMTLAPGENEKRILVEAEDGTRKTYLLHVNRPRQEISITDLKLYGDDGKEIPFSFKKEISEYILSVSNHVTKLTFKGTSEEDGTSFVYPENTDVSIGFNNYYVIAKTENQKLTYSFNIFREPSELQMLSLIGEKSDDTVLKLEPEFSPEITEYSATVPADVQRVKFLYTLANNSDKLLEEPEFSLKEGVNECKLTVSDGSNERVYNFIILRDAYKRVEAETETPSGPIINDKEFTQTTHKELKILLVIGLILILGILVLVVVQLKKHSKEYRNSEDAMAEKTERERKKRLKQKEKERKKK